MRNSHHELTESYLLQKYILLNGVLSHFGTPAYGFCVGDYGIMTKNTAFEVRIQLIFIYLLQIVALIIAFVTMLMQMKEQK